jgi:hypothetical protein
MASHTETAPRTGTAAKARGFWTNAGIFVAIGAVLYAGLVVLAEMQVRDTGERNPFFQIATLTPEQADVVILGASHAMPLGFEGVDAALEAASGRAVTTLAIEGGGVVPNAVLLDAVLRKVAPQTVVYALDSFVFLSPQWNEERLTDADLYARAPYDGDILAALLAEPAARQALPAYLSGFDKANRLLSPGIDRTDAELTRFDRTYRPNDRIDDQRVAYLFPEAPAGLVERYVARLEAMAVEAREAGSDFVLLLMPAPDRYTSRLPEAHDAVMAAVAEVAMRQGLPVVDHTTLLQDDANYYDTDHLNRTGATAYAEGPLADALRRDP